MMTCCCFRCRCRHLVLHHARRETIVNAWRPSLCGSCSWRTTFSWKWLGLGTIWNILHSWWRAPYARFLPIYINIKGKIRSAVTSKFLLTIDNWESCPLHLLWLMLRLLLFVPREATGLIPPELPDLSCYPAPISIPVDCDEPTGLELLGLCFWATPETLAELPWFDRLYCERTPPPDLRVFAPLLE